MTNFTNTTFFRNTLACITAGIVGAIITIRITRRYLEFIPNIVFIALAILYLLAIIIYAFIWKRKRDKGAVNNEQLQAFWEGTIRYLIALEMFNIGLGKIFHVQFRTRLGFLDNPFNSLDNQILFWAFFGKHYGYTVVIAVLQMTAGVLLVYRKTRLFGIIFLLPILLNIVLLNHYYDFGPIVSSYTILLTLAAVYLLFLEYDRLLEFFFMTKSQLPVFAFKSNWKKNIIRYSIIFIPVLLIAINKFPLFYPEYTGTYQVQKLLLNNKLIAAPSSSRDSVLTKIFIDRDDNDFVMDYNDYRRRLIGSYTYNPAPNQFTVVWHWPQNMHDTLVAKILPGEMPNTKVLLGHMGKDTFRIEMAKVIAR
jgi:hypothetical protein